MAVAFDAFSQVAAIFTTSGIWTHTPAGTPKGVIVGIEVEVDSTDVITSVLYGVVPMVRDKTNFYAAGETGSVYTYVLGSGVPTGPQTITVTATGTNQKFAHAVTVTAATDIEVVDSDNSIQTIVANPSGTLQLASRTCFCCEFFFSGHATIGSITALANWTIRGTVDLGATQGGSHTYNTIGTTDVTFGYTAVSDDAVIIPVAVSEVAVVAASPKMLLLGAG